MGVMVILLRCRLGASSRPKAASNYTEVQLGGLPPSTIVLTSSRLGATRVRKGIVGLRELRCRLFRRLPWVEVDPGAYPALTRTCHAPWRSQEGGCNLLTRWKDFGAGEGIRTLDPNLGKVMLYP